MSGRKASFTQLARPGSHHLTALLLSALVFLPGCSTDPVIVNPSEFEKLYVLGVLSPQALQQEVYLSVSQLYELPKPVENATVRISSPKGEIHLVHVSNGIYRDLSGKLEVSPGNDYRLLVNMSDGRELSATTRVPTNFQILQPLPGDTIRAHRPDKYSIEFSLPIKWTIGTGWITQVTIHYQYSEERYDNRDEFITAGDTLFYRRGTYAPTDTSITGGILYLTHYDSVFSIHQLLQRTISSYDFPLETINQLRSKYADDRINVNGAFGVFGSVVVDSVRFHLRVEKEQP